MGLPREASNEVYKANKKPPSFDLSRCLTYYATGE